MSWAELSSPHHPVRSGVLCWDMSWAELSSPHHPVRKHEELLCFHEKLGYDLYKIEVLQGVFENSQKLLCASALRALPAHEFCQRSFVLGYGKHEGLGRLCPACAAGSRVCQRSFVLGYGKHEGLGNNLYKILTAPALALMLNRSIIVGEN
ncbi:unnamed protein product, partial [Closterium sp. NIES-65]